MLLMLPPLFIEGIVRWKLVTANWAIVVQFEPWKDTIGMEHMLTG